MALDLFMQGPMTEQEATELANKYKASFPWQLASRIWFIVGRVGFVDSATGKIDNEQTENHCVAEFIPGEHPIIAAGLPINRDDILAAGAAAISSGKYGLITIRYKNLSIR